jgi:hypothetical protein
MHAKRIARCVFVAFVVAATVCSVASARQIENEIVMRHAVNRAKLGVSY